MSEEVCYRVGRSGPMNGFVQDEDTVGSYHIETWNFLYLETLVCMPRSKAEEIARELGKKFDELTEDDVADYLINKERIDEKVEGKDHVFERDC